ncbi:aldolase [Domibacillus sp.]|uniref:aldolase n=1 Tax=Domibacillus sp. TaxID=1969783 RepID=UPI002810ABA9|nr:aldolase [Domibacillus sp.]
MVEKNNMYVYKAFGLCIRSEVSLPEIIEIEASEKLSEDIVVKEMDLTSLWLKDSIPGKHFVITENTCLFNVPEVAIYFVQNGNEVIVSPFNGSDEDQRRLYILGTCMGAVLMQRKILPLHGSAVAIDGKAYAIVGDSGAGKSTLASAFLNNGCQLLSDDVIPITISMENIPMVTPAYPQQKLWLESLHKFGMKSNQYRPIFARETKFAVPVSTQFAEKPLPLAGIYELVKTDHEKVNIHEIENMERFYTLFKHTYRNFFITRAHLMEWHFQTSAHILSKISMYQLQRPTSRFTAANLTDLVLSTITKEEMVYE